MNDEPPPPEPSDLPPDPDPLAPEAVVVRSQHGRELEADLAPPPFRFLTDHNVPDSLGNALGRLGHDVVRLRDAMAVNTTDPVVAQAAIQDNRVLISWDRDFGQQRFMTPRFAGLSRLSMSGPEMDGAARLEAVFDIVAFAMRRAAGGPVTIRVGVGKVQIHV